MAEEAEGRRTSDGGWEPTRTDSPHRKLNSQEYSDLVRYAEATTPSFEGPHNTPWEGHHPVAREVWEKKGVKP